MMTKMSLPRATVGGQMVKNAASFVCNKSLLIVCRLDQCPILLRLSFQSELAQAAQPPFISAAARLLCVPHSSNMFACMDAGTPLEMNY